MDRAMVLAAGLGTRMRPLTLQRPKPLIEVGGRAMLERILDALRAHGTRRAVVNMHWLAEQIEAWAARQEAEPEIILSDERGELLETGGGIRKALPLLGERAFFVLNGDSFWLDGAGAAALDRLAAAWNDDAMDCLALTVPLSRAIGYAGKGDFLRDGSGRLSRPAGNTPQAEAEAFTGVYVVHPRLFAAAPAEGPFSMNLLFDAAMAKGRMHGLSHDGLWLHVGTPQAIAEAERAMAEWKAG